MLPLFDLNQSDGQSSFDACLKRIRDAASVGGKWFEIASKLIEQVRRDGDDAVVSHMREFTDPSFTAARIRVDPEELADADCALTGDLRDAIAVSIEHVRAYQRHILPSRVEPVTIDGAELGMRWTVIEPVGLLVPGGSAVLFSTLIMLAVPASVAGVKSERMTVVSPPPYVREGRSAGDISPITLAVCHMLGIDQVYRIGGPVAVAALAFGTERISPVHLIAGPGHPVVQAAKLQVAGRVAIDGFLGSSEVVVIADGSADVSAVAADLIAQAEHDPGKCFLVSWSHDVIDRIFTEIQHQLPSRGRRAAIEQAFRDVSCAVLVRDEAEAAEVADRFAAEHVTLAVADPDAMLSRLSHGGEFFLGNTPVAAGDYYAGPSHSLPTDTSARFTSGISIYTFLKRSGTVAYRNGMSERTIEHIATLAKAEGLDAHVASVRARKRK